VDNASSDDSVAMIRQEYPRVKLIANSTNRGFAAATNQGFRLASGRYVLVLNPDTVILDAAIDRMLAWIIQHPGVGCVGCQVFESKTEIQRTCFRDPSPFSTLLIEIGLHRVFPRSHLWGMPYYSWWDRTTERDVDVVSGMFMLIPREVLDRVGQMDEAFFIYAEEADLCRRIRRAGWRCVFAPDARILHRDGGGKSTAQVKPLMNVQLQKSLFIYLRKYNGPIGCAFARIILVVSNLLRWAGFGLGFLLAGGSEMRVRAKNARTLFLYHVLRHEPAS
jgi:hypothetical protein